MLDRNCPLCKHPKSKQHVFTDNSWNVVKCSACSMIYLKNPPDQSALFDEVAWEKTQVVERAKRRKNRKTYYFVSDGLKKLRRLILRGKRREIEILNKLQPLPGSILDIGCGPGVSMSYLNINKWTCFGIEPSPGLYLQADVVCQLSGGYALQDTAINGTKKFATNFFDVIHLRSFLEHDAYAKETLFECYRTLKNDGFVLIKVPNANCWNAKLREAGWPGVRHPDHVNYFTPDTLSRMLKESGFSKLYFPMKWRLPTSDNMWVAAYK